MTEEPLVDAWLDEWLCVTGAPLKTLIHDVAAKTKEHGNKDRKRARRAADQQNYLQALSLVICNIVWSLDRGPVAYSRAHSRKRTRYTNLAVLTRTFLSVIDAMGEAGLLELTIGVVNERRSTFAPTEAFRHLIATHGVTKGDVGRTASDETIVLSQKHQTGLRQSDNGSWFIGKTAKRVDYADNETTRRLRAEMAVINASLAQAHLSFEEDSERPSVNVGDRYLRRYFAQLKHRSHFDKGGRLFGGWWLNLSKARRASIRIDGERVALLDYRNMFCRLAYSRHGIQTDVEEDLYDLTGHLKGFVLAQHREGVKTAFNALLFGGKKLAREVKLHLPPRMTMTLVKAGLASKHPALAKSLGDVMGYDLMLLESNLLVETLTRLNKEGIAALPLHDGLLVSQAKADRAYFHMVNTGKELYNVFLPVSTKDI